MFREKFPCRGKMERSGYERNFGKVVDGQIQFKKSNLNKASELLIHPPAPPTFSVFGHIALALGLAQSGVFGSGVRHKWRGWNI